MTDWQDRWIRSVTGRYFYYKKGFGQGHAVGCVEKLNYNTWGARTMKTKGGPYTGVFNTMRDAREWIENLYKRKKEENHEV